MNPSNIDVAVLLIFFVRPEMTRKVFEQIRLARPSRLYLYQDGARPGNESDRINVEKCRQIVSEIDWECEVHRLYQEENKGCDPSEYLSQKWFFEHEEMGIILEDDDVPSQSFFPFCKELLEKYKDDERIYCISGMNHLGTFAEDYADYIFTTNQSIWGWASWRRCIDMWDTKMPYLDSEYAVSRMKKLYSEMDDTIRTCTWHRDSSVEYYESIGWACQNSNNMLCIVPTKNMISNIGIGADGTHASASLKEVPKALHRFFFAKTYELEFPLRHPPFVINDKLYLEQMEKAAGKNQPLKKWLWAMEGAIRRFWYAPKEAKLAKFKRLPQTIKMIIKK